MSAISSGIGLLGIASKAKNFYMMSKAPGMAGLAGKVGLGASSVASVLGPLAIGAGVYNVFKGAADKAAQARKQIKMLEKQSKTINQNIARNATGLRDDLAQIDQESQVQAGKVAQQIGEKLDDSTQQIGQTIKRGRGLLTGTSGIQAQEISSDLQRDAQNQFDELETQRGGMYGGLIDQHNNMLHQSQQTLLSIAKQQEELQKQDSWTENLF